MTADPAATLRCWPLQVDLAGATHIIPAHPADVWLLALLGGTYIDVLPGLLQDKTALNDAIIDGAVSGEELLATSREVIAAASGMTWWTAVRLAQLAHSTWLGAELTLRGVNPAAMPLAAYLAAVLRMATRDMTADKAAQLTFTLDRPPAGVPAEQWFDEDAAADGFMAAYAGASAP
jgi:hypothetical protein